MRLTDDILRLSDAFHADYVQQALSFISAGRFGLLPSSRPFDISLDISKNIVDIVAADCFALTRSAQIIDISFDSKYTGPGDSRVVIPSDSDINAFLLLVTATGEWLDSGDGTSHPAYIFELIDENIPVPDNSIPVARIVNEMGWQEDVVSFVPPCLFLSSHNKYKSLSLEFRDLLSKLDAMVPTKLCTDSGDARRVFWPEVRRLSIVMDKEIDLMTPMSLLARVQECVSAFYCACTLDECLTLSDGDRFREYARVPYNFRNAYRKIADGLRLTSDICKKLEDFVSEPVEHPAPAAISVPFISDSEVHQFAVSNDVRVEVSGITPGATCYYSVDAGDPDKPLQGGRFVPLNPGFNKTRTKENDRTYMVRLKTVMGSAISEVVTYEVTVTKDVNVWKGFQI